MRHSIFLLVMALVISHPLPASAESEDSHYGSWVKYTAAEWIQFPDFKLRFLGKAENGYYPGQSTRRLAPIYRFEAVAGSQSVPISWSAGTGDIGPAKFILNGKSFFLELINSEILGKANGDESLVVWPEAEFLSRLRHP